MRLTKKEIPYITSSSNIIEIPDIAEGYKYIGQAIDKLGQLEDIEEELGIDLVTLYNRLKLANKTFKDNGLQMDNATLRLCGRTWNITWEELE